LDQLKAPESDSTENVPNRTSQIASYRDEGEVRAMRFAMRISLAFGVVMLVGKMAAYFMTALAPSQQSRVSSTATSGSRSSPPDLKGQ